MQVRIALLLGSYLISGEGGPAHVLFRGEAYGPDDALPVLAAAPLLDGMTAREFVRHSMVDLVGGNEQAWPALVRRFLTP